MKKKTIAQNQLLVYITDENYPLIKYFNGSQALMYSSPNLKGTSTHAMTYYENKKGPQQLLSYIIDRNNKGIYAPQPCYLPSYYRQQQILEDTLFREYHHYNFFKEPSAAQTGMLLNDEAGQYVYLLTDEEETKVLTGQRVKWIAAMYFKGAAFQAYEAATVGVDQFRLNYGGLSLPGFEPGELIKRISIFLSFLECLAVLRRLNSPPNMTGDIIYFVE